MAKREKKQRPRKMTRKYRSRVERERRQIRYIFIGIGVVVVASILVLLAGLYQTQVANPAATRRVKDELKTIPAATVNGTMISIADWQARVRYRRLSQIEYIQRISQQLSYIDQSSDFGQQLISQASARIEEVRNMLEMSEPFAQDVLDQMVEEQLIRQEAARRDIQVTPEELQEYIEVNVFYYPYPPTPEPFPTLPSPTLPPTATVTPVPTLEPTPSPTPLSLEEFEARYNFRTDQVKEIADMSEEAWRAMIEADLYSEKLLEAFGAEVETVVQQIQGSYIVTQDRETAEALLARLEAGETFEALVQEAQADESENPPARVGTFTWSPIGVIRERFGEEFATVAFNTSPGQYARLPILSPDGQFYLVYIEGNEERQLANYLVEQQRLDYFENWLDQQKMGEGVTYGNWQPYVPTEPSLQE